MDDIIPDEDTTCLIGNTINQRYYWEFYHTPLIDPRLADIAFITLFGRFRRQGGYAYIDIAKLELLTYGRRFESPPLRDFTEVYENRSWALPTNPSTGLPWTTAELDALQIGVALRRYTGVGWASIGYCTQLYLQVNFDFTYT